MRIVAAVGLAALGGGCSSPPRGETATESSAPVSQGFVELFNGTDLSGWMQRGGKAVYRVEDGCIVGETRPNQPNSFLCTTETYADFVLELEFKAEDEANSGVQFRSESRPDYQDGRVHGYQAEIDTGERAWTGGIYDEGRRGWIGQLDQNEPARRAYRHNEWNHLRIEAVGNRLSTWINGVPAAHLHDAMTSRGFIALQVHGVGGRTEPLVVRWRNLRINTLD